MTIEQLIGQFTAYTEYPNQDTFVISNQTCQDILKYLKQVPKAGHWIRCDVLQEFKCSECRVCFRNKSNYCPNCGCRMVR